MIPPDRIYLDPGDRWCGRYDPPRRCRVLTQWGRRSPRPQARNVRVEWLSPPGTAGPRNVLVEYLDDGSRVVVPFPRRLRRAKPEDQGDTAPGTKGS